MSRRIGTLSVLDLHIISAEYGRAFLPYPFRITRSVSFRYEHEMRSYQAQLRESIAAGEFAHLRRWLDVQLRDAEIRIESMFMDTTEVTDAFSATRWQDLGFIARQEADDTISVTQLSAYELGTEIGKLARLAGAPGEYPRVVIPSLNVRPRPEMTEAPESVIFDHVATLDPPTVVTFQELLAGGEIHTDHRPAVDWRPDRTKEFLGWVSTVHGDYIVQSPYEYATPVTRKQLTDRINELIAGDVAAIREQRAELDDVSARS